MANDDKNAARRRFLSAATCAVGAGGIGAAAVPFLRSWNPSAKARAAGAPVKADVGKLEPGQMMVVEWRGRPVYVLRRTTAQLATLPILDAKLKDPASEISDQPNYIKTIDRSLRPDLLVVVGICTHLGCAPKYRPEVGAIDLAGKGEWNGGFFCPCHGSKFDLAGRVYKGAPASTNLVVPPYCYENDHILVVGVNPESTA